MTATEVPALLPIDHPDYHLTRITAARAEDIDWLIGNAVDDEDLQREFSGTLAAYSQPISIIKDRLSQLYDVTPAQRIGYLIMHTATEEPIGMTYLGIRQNARVFCPDYSSVSFKGLNFSSWLLAQHRNKGVRSAIGDTLNHIGRQLNVSDDPNDAPWNGSTIYTGIRETNHSSERVATKLGYQPVGVLLHDSAYRAWLRPDEWQSLRSNT